MLRCTIELVPHGDESRAHPIGCIEIANDGSGNYQVGNYAVVLKKTAPWPGALKAAWKRGVLAVGHEDEEVIVGGVSGFHRQARGPYDLLYRALKACGLEARNR